MSVGASVQMPLLFALAFLTYPFSIGLHALARKHINKKCRFYSEGDNALWNIVKTIFMPIVSCGALIMYHLVTTTYRKMNESVEDSTGFSISSIIRTIVGLGTFIAAIGIVYLVTEWIAAEGRFSDNLVAGVFFFGGIVWLLDHILWDIPDFADKESDALLW